MLLTKSNSTKRLRPPTFKEGVTLPEHMDATSSMFITHLILKVSCLRACGYPSMTPVVGTEACLCPRYQKKVDNRSKKLSINQSRSIRKKSKEKKKLEGLVPPKKKSMKHGSSVS